MCISECRISHRDYAENESNFLWTGLRLVLER